MANQDRVNFVWAESALTTIPPIPVSEVAYRDTTQTPEQMEVGQQYDTIYNSARHNQLLFLLTSVAKTLCENGIMPFLAGQEYSQYARCIFTDGKLYTASRAILANEQPYPTPRDDSGVWTTKETDETFVPDSRHVIAGTGLTGGGPLSADVTLAAKLTDRVNLADSKTAASAKAVKAVYDSLEALRVSFLGVPRYWRSTTLPAGYVWANGDLALFSDWPELENLYKSGGLKGMLLSYDASPSTIAQYCGRWRLNASSPTGLYVPNLSERFINSTINTDKFGTANTAGVPNITGRWEDLHVPIVEVPTPRQNGAILVNNVSFVNNSLTTGGTGYVWDVVNFDASRSSAVYGRSPTVMPASVNYPIIIYLGNHS